MNWQKAAAIVTVLVGVITIITRVQDFKNKTP